MQYPVPQFTDVEDKLIGSLTVKQFGIIFGAGVVVFLGYSATKSIPVLVVMILLVGLPAIGLAFAPFNGRPMYRMLPYIFRFMTSPKMLIFHKEANDLGAATTVRDAELKSGEGQAAPKLSSSESKNRLMEINRTLEEQAAEEEQLLKRL